MNICLSIEATGQYLGFSLLSFDKNGASKSLQQFYKHIAGKQSEILIPTLDKVLRAARIKKTDLTMIAVDIGPGSFTGVRVGLAVARTLAQALELPLVGISSLDAMTWVATQKYPKAIVVPHLPASTSEVYFAATQGMKTLRAPCWQPETELKKFVSKNKKSVMITDLPHPKAVGELAIQRFVKHSGSSHFHYENVVPMYLQPSWAERKK